MTAAAEIGLKEHDRLGAGPAVDGANPGDPKVEAVENRVKDDPEGQDVLEDHCRTFLSRPHSTDRRNPGRSRHAMHQQQLLYSGSNRSGAAANHFR
ncbi:hypothetical protein AJ87_46880 [Rhizobium yanglingense]|nr:hypothetical protein AJ87_46880 [Rhizobium yanglingense]